MCCSCAACTLLFVAPMGERLGAVSILVVRSCYEAGVGQPAKGQMLSLLTPSGQTTVLRLSAAVRADILKPSHVDTFASLSAGHHRDVGRRAGYAAAAHTPSSAAASAATSPAAAATSAATSPAGPLCPWCAALPLSRPQFGLPSDAHVTRGFVVSVFMAMAAPLILAGCTPEARAVVCRACGSQRAEPGPAARVAASRRCKRRHPSAASRLADSPVSIATCSAGVQ